MAELPPVPLTLEGSYVLHQMFRLRRPELRQAPLSARRRIIDEAARVLSGMEEQTTDGHPAQTAVYSQVGHKGDLLLLHFRESLDAAHRTELTLAQLELGDYLEQTHSYLSVVELSLYESSAKTYAQLAGKGCEPHSAEWKAGVDEVTARQVAAMAPRLWPAIPSARYLCFYPMDRKRGEAKNWYGEPMAERQRLMQEHSAIGRRYADCVRQIITGSIGFDDWEWGVDLFADDPLVFKKLIYEMRFDEASAVYALFGDFHVGLRVPASEIGRLLFVGELD